MKKSLVITTINYPTEAVIQLAKGAKDHSIPFIIIGDKKTPADFNAPGAEYYSLSNQKELFPELAEALPENHYSRKNIGYLISLKMNVEAIQETDDDNYPLIDFWSDPITNSKIQVATSKEDSWCNVYEFFTQKKIWPRGYPLEFVNSNKNINLKNNKNDGWSILQGLADDNPDVDAIYRMTRELPIKFDKKIPVQLGKGLWCPFNSQNTIFKRNVVALMYLPSFCSFRMTDIWRSFIAQRCLWEINSGVIFHNATVYQVRNEHNLLRDFEQETSGYLLNNKISKILEETSLAGSDLNKNLYLCYEALVKNGIIPEKELQIVKLWISEVENLL